ncbi:ABC transporter ATP-binding protein [Homoserinibacter sp. GY 40078]|uniref:ABC transporter ATP-binding protein n=1 Tax=Homoserinibacter sp. GY 40078 TaxID=2603275 RepID=UPI0011CA03A8|nr:ABC transporter ATP-binding protein [Homoserinibacter sp. GY 40078]TXK19899.1 ABC transporter ATP-binding protein [Homoserinibacter sp. GY 40078]
MTGPQEPPALALRDVAIAYQRDRPVVDALTLDIRAGEFVAIVGPNGCGKSTLLRAIARLVRPTSGEIVLHGHDIRTRGARELARELGLLSQSNSAPEGMRVVDLVARGRHPHRPAFAPWTDRDEQAVRLAMEQTSVTDLATRDVDTLSGGQRQRVWLAMALAQDTRTLLLDEPTTFLDIAHQIEALELLRLVNREQGRTIVAVLHDLNHAARYADRLIAMRDGKIVVEGPPNVALTAETVESVFDLPCRVLEDPETGTPLVIPRARG